MTYQAIVIGAGIAGLNAAKTLAMQGHSVCILEAQARLGGRVRTVSTQSQKPVELGALFINGRGTAHHSNPLLPLFDRFNIQTLPVNPFNSDSYDTHGNKCSLSKIWDSIQDHFKGPLMLLKEAKNVDSLLQPSLASLLSYTDNNIPTPDTPSYWARKWITAALTHNTGADITDLSLQHLMQGPLFTGNREIIIGGCQKLIDGLYQEALSTGNVTLHLNQRVKEVHHSSPSSEIRIITDTGECYAASTVVCTVPLGVLKNNDLRFTPPLPAAKKTALQHLKVGSHNSVILEFTHFFWPDHVHYLHPNHLDISLWPEYLNLSAFMQDKTPTLMAQFHGKYAQFGQKTDREIIEMAMQPLRAVYGSVVEKLAQATISHWDTDIYSLGSSSYFALGSTAADIEALNQPEVGGLYFAGDFTALGIGESLEAAFLSGSKAGLEASAYITYQSHQHSSLNNRPRF